MGTDGRALTAEFRALREQDLEPDPIVQFRRWFADAAALPLAEAAALATADAEGRPSARMVLVKSWDERGFIFYSNYQSRKGEELAANPHAALLFHWQPLGRQVRLEGSVERINEADSDGYFASRPRASQLGAAASAQSQTVDSREDLDDRVRELEQALRDKPVSRPRWWGGYRLQPASYEFWQHRDDRLHDRIRFLRSDSGWRLDRLQP
jgi:pyridoxamine 5'-phosphate oxidase